MKITTLAIAAALLLAPGLASAATWDIDASHTSARFRVRHMVVSWTAGQLGPVTGKLVYDPKKPKTFSVEATIDVKGVDTGDAKRDEHLRNADFFEVEKHPTLTFKSKTMKAAGKGKMKVKGDLTIKGVTKEVTLEVEGPTKAIKDPWGNLRMGAVATTTINRKDFGITYGQVMDNGGLMVGDDVKIEIDIEFMTKEPQS